MASRTLSNPNIQVDNNTVSIVPNSLKYKSGKGDVKLNPQAAGGTSISMVISQDASTMKSAVSFSLYPTQTNIDLLAAWQGAAEGVSISFSDGTFTKQFRQMYVIGDPEIELGADKSFTVPFEGMPSI